MEEIEIKKFLKYLKKYIWCYVVFLVVAAIGVLVYDLVIKKPVYKAETEVIVATYDHEDDVATTIEEINASQKLATTFEEIAKSSSVLNKVVQGLELDMDASALSRKVTVKRISGTAIVKITVEDSNAELSALIADSIARTASRDFAKLYEFDKIARLDVVTVPDLPANSTLKRDLALAVIAVVMVVTIVAFLKFYFKK